MTATDLERKNISTVILAVFLGFSLSFRFLGINHPIMSYFSAFILCTVPGFLLIEVFNVDFEMHEIIPFSVILSLGFITILGSWLTVLPSHFNLIGFYTVIFILLLIRHKSKCHNKIQAPIILLKKEIFTILVSLLILSIPILFLGTILDDKYFLGYDPFLNEPLVSKIIHEKMQTIEILTDESIVFSGFFFLVLYST